VADVRAETPGKFTPVLAPACIRTASSITESTIRDAQTAEVPLKTGRYG